MKSSSAVFGVLALVVGGCASAPAARPLPPPDAVGTARLMAAEIGEDAPRVGKAVHSESASDASARGEDVLPEKKHERRNELRPGGGFSGYK